MTSEDQDQPKIALRRLGVRTANIDALRRFYKALGFEVRTRDGVMDEDHLEIDLGSTLMVARPGSIFQPPSGGIDLEIEVDDPLCRLRQALDVLHPGTTVGGPVSTNLLLSDPDGRHIRLTGANRGTA